MVLGLPYQKELNFVDVFLNFKEEKMKKKFKLFATIGSLCLAVAMMTIGVLAATSQTLNVTSNVNFQTATVLVDIEGTVTGAVETVEKYTYTHDATDSTKQPDAWIIGALNFSEDNKVITYTVKVTNSSEFAIKVEVTPDAGFPATDTTMKVETALSDGADSVDAGAEATYTVTLTLLNFSESFTNKAVNFTVKATKA